MEMSKTTALSWHGARYAVADSTLQPVCVITVVVVANRRRKPNDRLGKVVVRSETRLARYVANPTTARACWSCFRSTCIRLGRHGLCCVTRIVHRWDYGLTVQRGGRD